MPRRRKKTTTNDSVVQDDHKAKIKGKRISAAPEETDMTPEQKTRADDAYKSLVHDARQEIHRAKNVFLMMYWDLGKMAAQLDDRNKYGTRTIERFAADVNFKSGAVYAAKKFHDEYGQEEVQRLEKTNISWKHITVLSRVKDKAKRKELIEKAIDEQWSSRVLEKEVRSYVDGSPTPSPRKPKTSRGVFAKIAATALILRETLGWARDAASQAQELEDEAAKEKVLATREESIQNLVSLRLKIDEILKAIDKK